MSRLVHWIRSVQRSALVSETGLEPVIRLVSHSVFAMGYHLELLNEKAYHLASRKGPSLGALNGSGHHLARKTVSSTVQETDLAVGSVSRLETLMVNLSTMEPRWVVHSTMGQA